MDYSKFSSDTLDKISRNEPLDYSKLTDAELEEISKFKSAPAVSQQVPSMTESALRGAAQGLTFGFADELQAKTEQLLGGEDYDTRIKQIREDYRRAEEENPVSYYGANFGSGFLMPIGAVGGFAKGASLLGKIGKSAASGGAIGAVTGAGTSEGETAGEVAKDIAIGGAAGAVAAPLLEGGISAAMRLAKGATSKVGALRDVGDFYKYGKEGVALTGSDNLRNVTDTGLQTIENKLIPELEQALKVKNQIYAEGKEASLAAGKSTDIARLEQLVDTAEKAGVDPRQIEKLRRELARLGKKTEVDVTDPAEYQKLYREKLASESKALKEKAYEIQMRNADKAAKDAARNADKMNRDLLRITEKELKAANPDLAGKELRELAQKQLSGKLKDPRKAAVEAREKVIKEAEENFRGQELIVDETTGMPLATAATGENKRVITEVATNPETGQIYDTVTSKAAKDIQRLADKNAAQAYALVERENTKAIENLAKVYAEKGMAATRKDLIDELKTANKWIDPVQAAKKAKDETILSGKPIDVQSRFSPEINKDVLTARAGDEDIISKIMPDLKFTKPEYQNPNLDVRDVEAFRNFASDLAESDKALDYRTKNLLTGLAKETRKEYNELLGEETAKQALQTDQTVRKALSELGVESLVGDASIENKVGLRDKLARIMATANAPKGATESLKVRDAFSALESIYKNNPAKMAEIKAVKDEVSDKMRQAYLSDITTGHNTFAIDPASINWTMTAGGKIGMAANEAGLLVNKIANSTPGQLMLQSKKLLDKGYKKYSSVFDRMSSTEDINKRRALLYTLMQDPNFRQMMAPDILGLEEE